MSAGVVGKGVDRVDGRLKVTGAADYAAEVPLERTAHAVVLGATIARGRVTALDRTAAERAPGVLAVLTHENAPKLPGATKKAGPIDRVLQVLQDADVRYQDQPIALVVAETLEAAERAAALLSPAYADAPFTVDMAGETPRAYVPESTGPQGAAASRRGDAGAALGRAAVTVDQTYTTPAESHNPMEMHATVATWDGPDRLTVYDATQGIFGVRKKLAIVFDLAPDRVRVVSHFLGGGFGCKGSPWSHVVLSAMAARVVGRPVKLVLTRAQMFSLVGHRPPTVQRVALGATAAGKLVAIRHEVLSATSRFDEFVEPSAVVTRMLYACENVETSHRLVRLDAPTPTFMRAPGESSGTFALESAMDELAYALKMDPIALRLANHADASPEDGKPWSSKSLQECYRRAARAFGWAKRRPEPGSMRRGRALVGWGMATSTYPARQSPASASATLRADGTALVQAGSQDLGTGTYTIMTQIAADAIGLPLERVRFELGDTDLPETPVSGGSQTAASTGSAVKLAGLELRRQLAQLAVADATSKLHGLPADAVEAADGALFARSDPGRRDALADVLARSGKAELTVKVDAKQKEERERFACHAFGAQLAEVEVDADLGEIRVTRMVGAFAAGRILNEKTALSQLQGGMVWAIGMALEEHTRRDARTGRAVTRDLADYHVPVHADVPPLEVIVVPEDDPHVNEVGAKGIGEIGITGGPAAIANAVFHATGKRVRDLPITLDRLL